MLLLPQLLGLVAALRLWLQPLALAIAQCMPLWLPLHWPPLLPRHPPLPAPSLHRLPAAPQVEYGLIDAVVSKPSLVMA